MDGFKIRDEAEAEASTTFTADEVGGDKSTIGFDAQTIRAAFVNGGRNFRFRLELLKDIALDRSPQWLITGLMPAVGLHVLYGAPGTGKSFLALSAALHVAAGMPWGGRSVKRSAVVYVASEGGRNFRKRVVAARTALAIPDDVHFALVTVAPTLGGPHANTNKLIEEIKAQTAPLGWDPKLIVVDTLSRSIDDLNESSSQDIMDFVRNAEELSRAFNATVMPVHHCGKDESKGMRGSSALHGSADAEWMVSRHPMTGERQLTVEKMKDGPAGGRLRYDLVDFNLGVDEDEQPIKTCVAKVFDLLADAPAANIPQEFGATQEHAVLITLKMLTAIEGRPVNEGSGFPPGGLAVSRERFKEMIGVAGVFASSTPATIRVALSRAFNALKDKNILALTDEFLCLIPAGAVI